MLKTLPMDLIPIHNLKIQENKGTEKRTAFIFRNCIREKPQETHVMIIKEIKKKGT